MILSKIPSMPRPVSASERWLRQLLAATPAGGTVTLDRNVSLGSTLEIDKAITVDGAQHTVDYGGGGEAIAAATNGQLTLKNLKLNAIKPGGCGIGLYGPAPKMLLDNCTLTVHTRGISTYSDAPASGAAITVQNNAVIQNSQIPNGSTYENWAFVGDTRGISAWNLKAAAVTVSNSTIQGFGSGITVSGTVSSGISDTQSTVFTVTDSTIRGWAALNIWSVNATYNITNSHLIGINAAASGQNSSSTIVLNKDIYGEPPITGKPNVFNFTGGEVRAFKTAAGNTVDETLFRVDEEYQSQFHFHTYEDEETFDIYYVTLFCDKQYNAFVGVYPGMTEPGLRTWVASHVTGNLNTMYNWRVLAPGMESAPWQP